MRILVTGVAGQLARSLEKRGAAHPWHELLFAGRPQLDLTQPGSAASVIKAHRPDLVINAAAYTAVDQAESEPEAAYRINADGAGEVARAAEDVGSGVIQLSTDYVFDGGSPAAYREEDPVSPLGIYGRSKLAGEEQVRVGNSKHIIIRTSWVYSPFGRNFVKAMIVAAKEHDTLRVVADQRGSPTSALDLAEAILEMADAQKGWGATYHVAGAGAASWFELAEATMDECRRLGLPAARVEPITTEEWPTPARRPVSSVLDCERFKGTFGHQMREWRQSLSAIVEQIAEGKA